MAGVSKVSVEEKAYAVEASTTEDIDRLRDFQLQSHSFRINVSDVAACAGFHPYRSLPNLLRTHVYQGYLGQKLLQKDASLLDLNLVSDEQILLELAELAGSATQDALKHALDVKSGKKTVQTVETAELLKQNVVDKATASKRLSKAQLRTLTKGAQNCVNTGFGTMWENEALDLYEEQCGWEVTDRNLDIYVWSFDRDGNEIRSPHSVRHRVQDDSSDDEIPSCTEEESRLREVKRRRLQESSSGNSVRDADSLNPLPFFSLRGAVDGIREELAPVQVTATTNSTARLKSESKVGSDDDDDDSWVFRRVIVECKHRMKNFQPNIPLYEMIQATVYCRMYGTEVADLVQVLRRRKTVEAEEQDEDEGTPPDTKEEDESSTSVEISVNRISISDPIFQHQQNWYIIILPRLLSWTQAVYSIRQDDSKRYQLLSALSTENLQLAWKVLLEECPWLHGCDTSYHRDTTPSNT